MDILLLFGIFSKISFRFCKVLGRNRKKMGRIWKELYNIMELGEIYLMNLDETVELRCFYSADCCRALFSQSETSLPLLAKYGMFYNIYFTFYR